MDAGRFGVDNGMGAVDMDGFRAHVYEGFRCYGSSRTRRPPYGVGNASYHMRDAHEASDGSNTKLHRHTTQGRNRQECPQNAPD